MLKYTCKLCTFRSSISFQDATPFQAEYGLCDLCMDDVHAMLKVPHQFNRVEFHLRINLRKLRESLSRVSRFEKEVSSILNIVQSEVSAIENELGELISDYPSIAEILSEYRSLLLVYKL